MNSNIEITESFNTSDKIVRWFYRYNKKLFSRYCFDLEDLLQIGRIEAFKIFKKCKNENSKKRNVTICKYVKFRLIDIKKEIYNKLNIKNKEEINNEEITIDDIVTNEIKKEETLYDKENGIILQKQERLIEDKDCIIKDNIPPFLFEDIKQLLKPKEYQVLYKRFKENKDNTTISSEMHLSINRILQLYNQSIKKLRTKFKK